MLNSNGTTHPLTYDIRQDTRRVVVTYHGQPTIEQWRATIKAAFGDPVCQPSFDVVLDRSATGPPTTQFIEAAVGFVDYLSSQRGPVRWAMVSGDIGSYGMGRMAEQIAECRGSIRVFKSIAAAFAWLDEPPNL